MKYPGSEITLINGGASSTLLVSDVKYLEATENFDRAEFAHDRLRNSVNKIGQKPLLIQLLGNTPGQIVITGSSFEDIVPTNPDVTVLSSNFGNVKKKFNIKRYEITGAVSLDYNINSVFNVSINHVQQLAKFQAHLAKAAMETEYAVLITMQSETFSYLTTTGINLVGNSLGGTVSNVLITSFSPSVEYEELIDTEGNYVLLKAFSMVVEQRTITALDSVV